MSGNMLCGLNCQCSLAEVVSGPNGCRLYSPLPCSALINCTVGVGSRGSQILSLLIARHWLRRGTNSAFFARVYDCTLKGSWLAIPRPDLAENRRICPVIQSCADLVPPHVRLCLALERSVSQGRASTLCTSSLTGPN